METALWAIGTVTTASLLAWTMLVLSRGGFWRTDQRLQRPTSSEPTRHDWPSVGVVIPARNEADILPESLPTVLRQEYGGPVHAFLVDDRSEDGTGEVARRLAADPGGPVQLTVMEGQPTPPGWAGKTWALRQGVEAAGHEEPEFLWLTDADISHPPHTLRCLVDKATGGGLDLVSLMVQLRAATFWERLLIPAFVYFFGMLYPFRWVNDPRMRTAAAAGGCVLVRRTALERAGGFERIAGAIIDDCALAGQVKRRGSDRGGRLWLGLSQESRSLRAYDGLKGVWEMVARTAFTQLEYSPLLLAAAILGMAVVYVAPPAAAAGGVAALVTGESPGLSTWVLAAGASAWALMAGSFVPMLRWYRVSSLLGPLLTVAGALYTLMTVDSAVRHWRGRGGAWKGRAYSRHRSRGQPTP